MANDTPVAQVMANKVMELQTEVKTKLDEALQRVRTNMTRQRQERARFNAENMEAARVAVMRNRTVDMEQAPEVQTNKITRFQPGEQHKPKIMDIDGTYGI